MITFDNVEISLKAARVNAELSQIELAEKLSVSANTVAAWENGTSEPNWSQLKTISTLSKIPMDIIYVHKNPKIRDFERE